MGGISARHQRFKLSLGTGWDAQQGTRHPVALRLLALPSASCAWHPALWWPQRPISQSRAVHPCGFATARLSAAAASVQCLLGSPPLGGPPPSLTCSWAASSPPPLDAPSEWLQRSQSPLLPDSHPAETKAPQGGGLQGTGPPRGDRAGRIRTAPNRASRAATVHGPARYLTSPLHSPCRCSARGLGSQQPRNLLGALLQGGQLGNGPGQGPQSWAGGWSVPGSCPLSRGGHWGLWVDLDRRPMTQGRPCGRWWAGSRALKDEPWAWGPLGGGTTSCD